MIWKAGIMDKMADPRNQLR